MNSAGIMAARILYEGESLIDKLACCIKALHGFFFPRPWLRFVLFGFRLALQVIDLRSHSWAL